MKNIKLVELFAGIGGFRYGLEKTGKYEYVWANEWNKYAVKIYEKNFGEKPDTRDIRTIEATEVPNHDLLTAGFPCQAFSIAGHRKGFEDTRGTLFFDIARILNAKKPRYLLLENVKGLLSHDKGRTFKIMLSTLDELGYDLQWQVLNSKNFGVPQNRERVFIIGHIRGTSRPKVFPFRNTNEFNNDKKQKFSEQVSNTLRTNYSTGFSNETYVLEKIRDGGQAYRTYNKKGISPTIPTSSGGHHIPMIEDSKIRRLTPTECERLQGFPDGWTEGVSDTQRYKMLGNAVTTNVITEIGRRLLL